MRPRYYASRAFACSLVSRLNAAAEQRSLKVLAVIRYALYDETPVPLREQLVSGSGMRVNAEQLRSESQVVEITKQVRVSKEIHLQKIYRVSKKNSDIHLQKYPVVDAVTAIAFMAALASRRPRRPKKCTILVNVDENRGCDAHESGGFFSGHASSRKGRPSKELKNSSL